VSPSWRRVRDRGDQADDSTLAYLLHDERRAEILTALQTEAPGRSVEPGQLDADQLCHITGRTTLAGIGVNEQGRTENDFVNYDECWQTSP